MTQQIPAPELAASKALYEIIDIAKTHQPPDEFTHKRLERAARSSIQINPAASYSTLGALEAISGNEELMDEYHKKSIKLSNDALMYRNYASSLCHVSRIREAAEQSRIAASLSNGDLVYIHSAISNTVQSGAITMAKSLVDTYKKLVPTDKGTYENLISAATLQKNIGISDEEIMRLVQIACDFLRSKKVHYIDQDLDVDEEDEGFISLCINLRLPNEEIWNFNRQLFEIMMEHIPDQSPQLSVRFGRSRVA